jgi:hypothetical protein
MKEQDETNEQLFSNSWVKTSLCSQYCLVVKKFARNVLKLLRRRNMKYFAGGVWFLGTLLGKKRPEREAIYLRLVSK